MQGEMGCGGGGKENRQKKLCFCLQSLNPTSDPGAGAATKGSTIMTVMSMIQ